VLRGNRPRDPTGSITVVIGRSGGGKSVFLKHLIGLLRPDAGRVLVDDQEITRLSGEALDAIRRRYGVVFQGGALFDSMRCGDNVAFPLREKVRLPKAEIAKRVDSALAQVGSRRRPEVSGRGVGRHAQARGHRARARDRARDRVLRRADHRLDPVLVNTIHHLILDLTAATASRAVMVSHEIRRSSRSPTASPCSTRVVSWRWTTSPAAGVQNGWSRSSSAGSRRNLMERVRVNIVVGLFMVLGIVPWGIFLFSSAGCRSWRRGYR